ncbi:neurotransmitter-gated ion-channel ligand binding domain-containing protein [Ditylenchus destructor]|nr:neurotransmitter-gated ion-channel ligand binding domain-containing protein [Ditylenchus destructor]
MSVFAGAILWKNYRYHYFPTTGVRLLRHALLFYFIFNELDPISGFFATKHKSRVKPPLNLDSGRAASSSEVGDLLEDSDEMTMDPNTRLSYYIKSRAKPYRRPVLHGHDLIDVHVRASLYQIVDLDQRNNLATLSAYFDVWWMDAFIPWNISDFESITHTFVPVKWIWKPEFYLYHSIQGRTPEYDPSAMVELRHDGMVRLFVPITSRALCPINVKYFPYDTQNCSFLVSFIFIVKVPSKYRNSTTFNDPEFRF